MTYPHRYKNKREHTMDKAEFRRLLAKARELREKRSQRAENDGRIKDVHIPALLTVLYYCGIRITEATGDKPHAYRLKDGTVKSSKPIRGLVKESISIDYPYIRIVADECRKHGRRESPLYIPLGADGVNDILVCWLSTK